LSATPAIPPLRHRVAAHCGSGAFRDLLEHAGLAYGPEPFSEAMAFGLGGGIGLRYADRPPGAGFPFYLMGREPDLEMSLCRNLAVEAVVIQTDDSEHGWHLLRDELDAGRPALIWTNSARLPYLREALAVTVENPRHALIVLGYDEAAGIAYVADQYFKQPQVCDLDELAAARSTESFPGPTRHAIWRLAFPAELPPLDAVVRAALTRTVLNVAGGIGALVELGRRLGTIGDPEEASEAARWLRFWVRQAGTGGAFFRSLQADFLVEAAGLLEDRRLADVATAYVGLTEEWAALDVLAGLEREAAVKLAYWLQAPAAHLAVELGGNG
jgi:hypothetical protein